MKRDITVIGIDIAKRVFHVIGMDTQGTSCHLHRGVSRAPVTVLVLCHSLIVG